MTRLRQPMRREGVTTQRWARHRAYSREMVRRRAQGECEGCGRTDQPLEWCHIAGRGHIISEPYASSPELTFGLDRECHRMLDDGTDFASKNLRNELRLLAYQRLRRVHHRPWDDSAFALEPLEGIRRLVDELQQQEVVAIEGIPS